jgi:hypothetical protein|tara:strand:+ start:483 stop:1010 length:528 start_codon:yes stop_codon:yes gene_type:complete
MKHPLALINVYRYLCVLLLISSLSTGCAIVPKNSEGFYAEHYYSCGPKALEKALDSFFTKYRGYSFCPTQNEVSKLIQNNCFVLQEFLSIFNQEALEITWPFQIKSVLKKYNIEVVEVKDFNELRSGLDIAIVLVHSKLNNYHWLCFPMDQDINKFWGSETTVDRILLLRGTNGK